ncbi:MAG: glycosyltransferase family 4 protein [Pseudomonadota bacterium]
MSSLPPDSRVIFVQNGDFRAAAERIALGIGETYDAQKYSMDVVERLVPQTALTAVICITAEEPHDETLASGVRSIGFENIWSRKKPLKPVIAALEALAPTHLVLRLPSRELLTWARRRKVRMLPSFADSFKPRQGLHGWVDRLRLRRLAQAIDHPSVDFAGNHNVGAAESLAAIGVRPEKIIPWDWPRSPTPADFPSKAMAVPGPKKLVYVGSVTEAKGVGDVLRALAAEPGLEGGTTLEVVGAGDIDDMKALARSLGVADRVTFVGRVPHAEVAPRMHAADAVLVYSRHAYGEGLPGTIYLALASRTPLVVSDHPMFVAYLRDGEDVLVAPERRPDALAGRLRRLLGDPALYERLSQNSEAAFARIVHPVLWGEFVERWLRDSAEDRAWLAALTLPRWRRNGGKAI